MIADVLISLADLGRGLDFAWLEEFARERLRARGWAWDDREGWYKAR